MKLASPIPPLTKFTDRFDIAAPIDRKHPRAQVAMKRRIRPVAHARDQAVLERIDVAIFDMACIIGVIADEMLPEPRLPDAAPGARFVNGSLVDRVLAALRQNGS